VVKTPEGKLEDPAQGVLAGASFPIRTGIMNMVKLAGCAPEEAIRMATETPAGIYHLSGRGKIQEGFSADLILYKIINGEMVIQKTLVSGIEVYSGI
jgi:N-acetylglucosamine-6-phosphate deacetylase